MRHAGKLHRSSKLCKPRKLAESLLRFVLAPGIHAPSAPSETTAAVFKIVSALTKVFNSQTCSSIDSLVEEDDVRQVCPTKRHTSLLDEFLKSEREFLRFRNHQKTHTDTRAHLFTP